ncbi:MAG: CDP-alcohol phosphatidyltransferase family protein [Amnibacterium sp.]
MTALEQRLTVAPADRRYRDALDRLVAAQKPGAGFPAYTRWVNRRFARYAAAAAYQVGATPNGVTAASAAVSAVGIGLLALAPVSVGTGFAAAALLALGYLLDSADGQVARLTGRGSIAGEWLDHVVDAIRTPSVHLAVLVGLLRIGSTAALLPMLFCVVAVGQFMSQVLAEQLSGRVHRQPVGNGVRQSWITLPTDTGVLCWLFLLWGVPAVFVPAYATLLALNVVHAAVSMRRKYQHLTARQMEA